MGNSFLFLCFGVILINYCSCDLRHVGINQQSPQPEDPSNFQDYNNDYVAAGDRPSAFNKLREDLKLLQWELRNRESNQGMGGEGQMNDYGLGDIQPEFPQDGHGPYYRFGFRPNRQFNPDFQNQGPSGTIQGQGPEPSGFNRFEPRPYRGQFFSGPDDLVMNQDPSGTFQDQGEGLGFSFPHDEDDMGDDMINGTFSEDSDRLDGSDGDDANSTSTNYFGDGAHKLVRREAITLECLYDSNCTTDESTTPISSATSTASGVMPDELLFGDQSTTPMSPDQELPDYDNETYDVIFEEIRNPNGSIKYDITVLFRPNGTDDNLNAANVTFFVPSENDEFEARDDFNSTGSGSPAMDYSYDNGSNSSETPEWSDNSNSEGSSTTSTTTEIFYQDMNTDQETTTNSNR